MDESVRPLLLIWPDEWPRHSVEVDLERPTRRFRFIRPEDRHTWVQLYSLADGAVVLDPARAAWGELLALLRARRCRHVEGLETCKVAISVAEASNG